MTDCKPRSDLNGKCYLMYRDDSPTKPSFKIFLNYLDAAEIRKCKVKEIKFLWGIPKEEGTFEVLNGKLYPLEGGRLWCYIQIMLTGWKGFGEDLQASHHFLTFCFEVRRTCLPLRDANKFNPFILRKARLRSQSSNVYKSKCSHQLQVL